ncbi:hypothetical protein SB759_05120, partial [Pseudomonas sp. SIMBA_059]
SLANERGFEEHGGEWCGQGVSAGRLPPWIEDWLNTPLLSRGPRAYEGLSKPVERAFAKEIPEQRVDDAGGPVVEKLNQFRHLKYHPRL